MTQMTPGPIASFLATKTGLSTAVITGVLTVAVPVISAAVMHKVAFDKGWGAYEDSLRAGTAELDGKVIEVIDADTKQATEDAIYLRGQMDGFKDAQSQFIATLEGINANHAKAIGAVGRREYTSTERSWRDTDVPVSTSLRLDRIITTRGADFDRGGLPNPADRRPVANYLASDSDSSDSEQWRP